MDASIWDRSPNAEFSPCRTWRFVLRRRWSTGEPLGFILLNPSSADEETNDPTIRRCIGFARALGHGGLVVGNLFAFRATDPQAMRSAADPIGPGNDAALVRIAQEAGGRIICGWGGGGAFLGRGREVLRLLWAQGVNPQALAMTSSGYPGHPLYLKASLRPFSIGAKE